MKEKTAFLSALGAMGRRHLLGLVRSGYKVFAVEPSLNAYETARADLISANLDENLLYRVDGPRDHYQIAVFSETANFRYENFADFVESTSIEKILIEKPISSNYTESVKLFELAKAKNIHGRCSVNFVRRTWPHINRLKALCDGASDFSVTVNGGAVGIGCNGIHYLDMFLYLSSGQCPEVRWSHISKQRVKSGRGEQFEDFGGEFVLEGERGKFMASLAANSSANVVMTVRGEHFSAYVDYGTRKWRLSIRNAASTLPNYRYGGDYKVVEEGVLELVPLDRVTELWAGGALELLSLDQALVTHRLLDQILRVGGGHPPYKFT
jgi:predicted dehydrogenase